MKTKDKHQILRELLIDIIELNKLKDDTLFLPHNLPVYEYIFMPNIDSDDFVMFRAKYIQNFGKNLEEFKNKINSEIIYAVFKIPNSEIRFKFYSIYELKELNKDIL